MNLANMIEEKNLKVCYILLPRILRTELLSTSMALDFSVVGRCRKTYLHGSYLCMQLSDSVQTSNRKHLSSQPSSVRWSARSLPHSACMSALLRSASKSTSIKAKIVKSRSSVMKSKSLVNHERKNLRSVAATSSRIAWIGRGL